jgi:hypothetical protein
MIMGIRDLVFELTYLYSPIGEEGIIFFSVSEVFAD